MYRLRWKFECENKALESIMAYTSLFLVGLILVLSDVLKSSTVGMYLLLRTNYCGYFDNKAYLIEDWEIICEMIIL